MTVASRAGRSRDIALVGAVLAAVLAIVASVLAPTAFAKAAMVPTHPTAASVSKQPSAITSMWAWGNSVDPAVDERGLGEAGMAPAAIASFAKARGLTNVYLSTPWASNEGAVAAWLKQSVAALHADGIRVSALGGDPAWLSQPALATQWVSNAMSAAPFDGIQFDLEPWAGNPNVDYSVVTPQYVSLVHQVRAVAGGATVSADLPYWLATTSFGSSTVFATLAASVDSVAIVVFADHAVGAGGIVPLASPAVQTAAKLGKPFSIGVETDLPQIAGGAQYTFYDNGETVLEAETAKVRAAFQLTRGYSGVTVEHLLAWESLIANSAAAEKQARASAALTTKPHIGRLRK
jgi:hypothetical protein